MYWRTTVPGQRLGDRCHGGGYLTTSSMRFLGVMLRQPPLTYVHSSGDRDSGGYRAFPQEVVSRWSSRAYLGNLSITTFICLAAAWVSVRGIEDCFDQLDRR